ncbi:MAG: GNAT family N-acetyltransferase [Acidobacteria bacterium]|nr:GNAT family N-acetyltransferase [Acidobacteriota bacterium]
MSSSYTSGNFQVRLATLDDGPAVVTLVNSAYRGASSRAGWTTEEALLDGIRIDASRLAHDIARDGSVVLVHEDAGEIVACVHLERSGTGCYLGMLTTKPTRQGHGLGREMLAAAERWAVDHWHARRIHMTVIVQREPLIAYYERRGYRQTGVRRPFPYGDERWGIPKRADLEFVVLEKTLQEG